MMDSAFSTFDKDYNGLIQFITRSEDINSLISKLSTCTYPEIKGDKVITNYLEHRATHKTYIYKLFVIILYGMLEQFIEDVIKEYIKECCTICSDFNKLPDKIKQNHHNLTFELVKKLHWPKYNHLQLGNIIHSLNQGINMNIATIIPESFMQNGGNYCHDEICKTFSNIGIDIKLLEKYDPLADYLNKIYGDNKHANLFFDSSINRIVTERNTIAHGGQQGLNLLDTNGMQNLATELYHYAKSVNNLLTDKIYELIYDSNPLEEFESDELLKNRTVIIPKLKNILLRKDNKIIAKRSNGLYPQYFIHKIINLQIDNFNCDSVNCENTPREVGIELDIPTKKNCRYKMMHYCPPVKLLI